MTHLDLFSGIGGFHLAAGWAGFETIGFSEIEPYCCQLLAEKWPGIRNYGDIRTTDFSGLRGGVTVLSAGVPCQPASLAGKRRGKDDDRWLWEAVLDVVGRVRPAWVIFENPPGILTLDEFAGVLLRLESLGYEVRAFSVPANAVGAKHRRQRVFIVAHAGEWRCRGELSGCQRAMADNSSESDGDSLIGAAGEALADAGGEVGRIWAGLREEEPEGKRWGRSGDESGEALADTATVIRSSGPYGFRLTESPLRREFNGLSHWLDGIGINENSKARAREVLLSLWSEAFAEAIQQTIGGFDGFSAKEVLLGILLSIRTCNCESYPCRVTRKSEEVSRYILRGLRDDLESFHASHQWRSKCEYCREYSDALRDVSHERASSLLALRSDISPLVQGRGIQNRSHRLKALGNAVCPQQAYPFFAAIAQAERGL